MSSAAAREKPTRPSGAKALVGRRAELHALEEHLARGERLVTLRGGPGIGKSRLARALADRLRRESPWTGSVFSVELGADRDLVRAIAGGVGLPSEAGIDGPAALQRRLEARGPVLVVLDDIDRVLDAVRGGLGRILEEMQELTVLVVSREALGIPGEVRSLLGPLPFSAPVGASGTGDSSFEEGSAEHLFTLRAEAVNPGCSRAPDWADGARRLVRRLGGNPLALECAAARMSLLTPDALIARLDARFSVLKSPPGSATRGLSETIAEAWDGLSIREQIALARLSILEVPARLEVLEALVVDGRDGALRDEALGLIDGLERRSLLVKPCSSDLRAPPRLMVFDIVRDLAATMAHDASRELEAARSRLTAWCVEFVERHHVDEAGARSPGARRALLEEQALLYSVVRQLANQPETDAAVEATGRILVGLDTVMRRVGAPDWVPELLRRVAQRPSLSPELRVRALVTLGDRAAARAAWEEAMKAWDEAVAIAVGAGDRHLEGFALYRRAPLVRAADCRSVEGAVRRGLELLDGCGTEAERAEAQAALALVRAEGGDFSTTPPLYAEAIASMRRVGMVGLLAQTLNNAAQAEGRMGRWRKAEGFLVEALACAESDGDQRLACVVRRNLGECALRGGRLDEARERFEQAREAARELGYPRIHGVTSAFLAHFAFINGAFDDARELATRAREGLERAWEDPAATGLAELVSALVSSAMGDASAAVEAVRSADGALARVHDRVTQAVAAIHRAHLAVLEGRLDGVAALVQADELLSREPATEPRGHELVMARRLLEATLARRDTHGTEAQIEELGANAGVIVARDGAWFSLPTGERVSLARKATARRVLARLAEELASGSASGVDIEGVFQAGWPGDNTPEPHRSNRVYVLIRRLRSDGLESILVHDGDGYRLEPGRVTVV